VGHRSIGEVLEALKGDFPDISVSKIRFLESQGLVNPARTPSGYRQFGDDDVARLRWILAQQRDHYLPLKVIRTRLRDDPTVCFRTDSEPSGSDAVGPDAAPSDEADAAPAPAPSGPRPVVPGPGDILRPVAPTAAAAAPGPRPSGEDRLFSRSELARAAGVGEAHLVELESYGLLPTRLDDDALKVARLAGAFSGYGVEARHLRMYKTFAEREAAFFEQVVMPVSAARRAAGDVAPPADVFRELAALGAALRDALLRLALGTPGSD
jgi:hypothetical protein